MQFVDMETVKKIMAEKGISVKALAAKTRKSPATVRKYLNGADQNNVRITFMEDFAKALNVPEKTLYSQYFKAQVDRLNALYGKK